MKVLTVVVPTYNMEKYLDKCLSSLIVPELDLLDLLEVLVVNDGSKDRSSEIAHGYEHLYPNTFRVIDKQNGNYGSCINAALPNASGKYMKILDADDYFDTIVFQKYLRELVNVETDLVITDFEEVDEGYKSIIINSMSSNLPQETISPFEKLCQDRGFYTLQMHQITYRTSILKDMGYLQTEHISYTDTEWSFSPMYYVHTFYYIPNILYKYLVGRIGQTIDVDQMRKKYNDFCVMSESLISFYSKIEKPTLQADYLLDFMSKNVIEHLYRKGIESHTFSDKQIRCFDNCIKIKYPIVFNIMNEWPVRIGQSFYPLKYWRWHILWIFSNPISKALTELRIKLNLGRFFRI